MLRNCAQYCLDPGLEPAPNFYKIGTGTAINNYSSTARGTIMKKGEEPVFWQHAVEMNMGLSFHLKILVYHHGFDLNTILITVDEQKWGEGKVKYLLLSAMHII